MVLHGIQCTISNDLVMNLNFAFNPIIFCVFHLPYTLPICVEWDIKCLIPFKKIRVSAEDMWIFCVYLIYSLIVGVEIVLIRIESDNVRYVLCCVNWIQFHAIPYTFCAFIFNWFKNDFTLCSTCSYAVRNTHKIYTLCYCCSTVSCSFFARLF